MSVYQISLSHHPKNSRSISNYNTFSTIPTPRSLLGHKPLSIGCKRFLLLLLLVLLTVQFLHPVSSPKALSSSLARALPLNFSNYHTVPLPPKSLSAFALHGLDIGYRGLLLLKSSVHHMYGRYIPTHKPDTPHNPFQHYTHTPHHNSLQRDK